jgi:hypothetical protein
MNSGVHGSVCLFASPQPVGLRRLVRPAVRRVPGRRMHGRLPAAVLWKSGRCRRLRVRPSVRPELYSSSSHSRPVAIYHRPRTVGEHLGRQINASSPGGRRDNDEMQFAEHAAAAAFKDRLDNWANRFDMVIDVCSIDTSQNDDRVSVDGL